MSVFWRAFYLVNYGVSFSDMYVVKDSFERWDNDSFIGQDWNKKKTKKKKKKIGIVSGSMFASMWWRFVRHSEPNWSSGALYGFTFGQLLRHVGQVAVLAGFFEFSLGRVETPKPNCAQR
ncbi:conserved hypothetical protein [Trichinella spiralis]|uniref:hypothetical protein n=1 Tax=Trichinella spiralis TaxID=6334 RepID=UPI0001EFD320|nr:conserved hypothetical protein [Trichinella spiralis]